MFQDVIGNNFEKLFEIMSFCQTIMLSSTRICCAFDAFLFLEVKIIEYVIYHGCVHLYERHKKIVYMA